MVEYHPATRGTSHVSLSPSRLTSNDTLNRFNTVCNYGISAVSFLFKTQHGTKEGKSSRRSKEKRSHTPPTDKICLTQYKPLCHPFKLCCSPVRVCFLFTQKNEEGTYHHQPFHNFNQQSSHYTIYLQEEIRLMKLKCSVSCLLPLQSNHRDKLEDYGKHNEYICYHTTCPRQEDTIGTRHTIGRHVSPPQIGHGLYFGASTGRTTQIAKKRYAFCMENHTDWCRTVVKDTNGTQDTNGTPPSPPQSDRSARKKNKNYTLVNRTQSLCFKHRRVVETQDITRRRQEDTIGRHYTTGTLVLTRQIGKPSSCMGKHDISLNAIFTQDTNGSQDTTGTPQVKPAPYYKRPSNTMIQSYMPPGSTHMQLNIQLTIYKLVTRSHQETKLSKLEK
jgi:hypothetical protein